MSTGEPLRRDDYEIASQDLDPRRIELSITAATMLHDYVAQEYLPDLMRAYPPHKKKIVQYCNEEEDCSSFGSSFGMSLYGPSPDVSRFVGLKLTHLADAWQLRLRTSRYRHDGTPNRVATYYAIDTEGPLVLRAKVEARVLTTDSDEVYAQLLEDSAPPKISRRLYERHLTNRDSARVQEQLRHVANRCVALAS